jgi:biotin-(acetyl-CoA carboxylase) ligase
VTTLQGGKAISGIASGIDASGALLLTQPDGSTIPVRAGDVTLKK